jgi:hypothetical protein
MTKRKKVEIVYLVLAVAFIMAVALYGGVPTGGVAGSIAIIIAWLAV